LSAHERELRRRRELIGELFAAGFSGMFLPRSQRPEDEQERWLVHSPLTEAVPHDPNKQRLTALGQEVHLMLCEAMAKARGDAYVTLRAEFEAREREAAE
jgi:hypothetical protein